MSVSGINNNYSNNYYGSSALPPNPNDETPPFDPSVPSQYAPSGSGYPDLDNSVIGKLYEMVQWMKDHPGNKKAPEIFLLYISNLANAGYFDDPNSELTKDVLGLGLGTGSGQSSILTEIISLLVMQTYFNGDNVDGPGGLFDTLRQLFPGDDVVSQLINDQVDAWQNWWFPEFKSNHTDKDGNRTWDGQPITADQFDKEARQMWGNFILNANVDSFSNSIRGDIVASWIAGINDPAIILALLLALFEQDSSEEVSSEKENADLMQDYTRQTNDLLNEFETPFDSPEDAQDWMDRLNAERYDIDTNPAVSQDVKDQFDSMVDGIMGQQAVEKNPDYDPTDPTSQPTRGMVDSKGDPISIGDLYNGYTDPDGTVVGPQIDKLQESMNLFQPTDPSAPIPSQYQGITSNLKAMGSVTTDQAQTITTQMQQIMSVMQSYESSMQKDLETQRSFLDQLVANQKA